MVLVVLGSMGLGLNSKELARERKGSSKPPKSMA